MGTFRQPIEIGDAEGRRFLEIEALVDTGSTFTWIPTSILENLGIKPAFKAEFITIDGRTIEKDMAVVQCRLDGQTLPTIVVFGDEGSEPVMGSYTMEGFLLATDPVNQQLVHVKGYLLSAKQGPPLARVEFTPSGRCVGLGGHKHTPPAVSFSEIPHEYLQYA